MEDRQNLGINLMICCRYFKKIQSNFHKEHELTPPWWQTSGTVIPGPTLTHFHTIFRHTVNILHIIVHASFSSTCMNVDHVGMLVDKSSLDLALDNSFKMGTSESEVHSSPRKMVRMVIPVIPSGLTSSLLHSLQRFERLRHLGCCRSFFINTSFKSLKYWR